MSFLVRPHRRFPVPCADAYHAGPFLPLPLAYFSGLWQLIDFKWMRGNAGIGSLGFGPHRILSTKTHKQIDCAEKRLRLLAFTEYSRRMGTGIPADGYVDNGNWIPVEPDSINQALWEVACGKE